MESGEIESEGQTDIGSRVFVSQGLRCSDVEGSKTIEISLTRYDGTVRRQRMQKVVVVAVGVEVDVTLESLDCVLGNPHSSACSTHSRECKIYILWKCLNTSLLHSRTTAVKSSRSFF